MTQPDEKLLRTFTAEMATRGYRVTGELGRGGMGVVFRARHMHLNRDVAIKVLSSALLEDPLAAGRFRSEMTTMAMLSHPGIVRVTDGGVTQAGVPYFVMDFVAGPSLDVAVRNRPSPYSPTEAAELLRPVASALDYLHNPHHPQRAGMDLRESIVHRDIKPANIIVANRGGAVLTDFGIAYIAEATRYTREGMFMGTDAYMAPELFQAGGLAQDSAPEPTPASDNYSFALVALEMITKTRLHTTMTTPAWRSPSRPMDSLMELPHPEIFAYALSNKPADRFPTAEAFLDALAGIPGSSRAKPEPQPKPRSSRRPTRETREERQPNRDWETREERHPNNRRTRRDWQPHNDRNREETPRPDPRDDSEPSPAPPRTGRARGRTALALFGVAAVGIAGFGAFGVPELVEPEWDADLEFIAEHYPQLIPERPGPGGFDGADCGRGDAPSGSHGAIRCVNRSTGTLYTVASYDDSSHRTMMLGSGLPETPVENAGCTISATLYDNDGMSASWIFLPETPYGNLSVIVRGETPEEIVAVIPVCPGS